MKNILPDLAKMPRNDGTLTFYDFDSTFKEADADKLTTKAEKFAKPFTNWMITSRPS